MMPRSYEGYTKRQRQEMAARQARKEAQRPDKPRHKSRVPGNSWPASFGVFEDIDVVPCDGPRFRGT